MSLVNIKHIHKMFRLIFIDFFLAAKIIIFLLEER